MRFPVLMYHKVGEPVHIKADRFLNVSTPSFERQMTLLASMKFRVRPFAEIVEAATTGKTLLPRTLAITFDDGYANVGEHAAPILQRLNFPATVFVVSGGVGKTNAWDKSEGYPELNLMGWERLRQLQSGGWEIGGHTRTHPHLDALENDLAEADILQGKEEVEAVLGVTLKTFCYPFGHYSVATPELVARAGFTGACTTKSGIYNPNSDSPYLIPRVKIAYRDGTFGLLYRLLVRPHLPDLRKNRRDNQHK